MPASTRAMIDRLIALPSVSSTVEELDMGNRAVIDALATWLEDDGWRVTAMPIPGRPGKANLLASIGPEREGGLLLSGHADTVPYDEGKWSSDPFVATERDGRLYGLGTSDMKAFLALAIAAVRGIDRRALEEPVHLLATADEEVGMDGARILTELPARRAIVGEPTANRPVRLHKGIAMGRLALFGRSGHSSDPALGASALEGMLDAMLVLRELREELAETRNDELHPPVPTLNLGRVEGGDSANRICPSCHLDYDLRVLPGMDAGAIQAELRRRVRARLEGRGLRLETPPMFEPVPPFETPPDAALVIALEELTGETSGAVSFGTEAPFFQRLGVETVVMGPGDIDVAHQPDEFLALDRIDPTIDLLQKAIDRFCLRPAP
jgi:acetylornithine deacetylase